VDAEIIVAGGGPSGTVVAKLLASWGHDVRLLTRALDPDRALVNSLPPSTRKLLTQAGILDLVDRVGYRTFGNTVWWGNREGHVEPFAADGSAWGYQVPRAALDPLLLDRAAECGARVDRRVRVQRIRLDDDAALVGVTDDRGDRELRAALVIDGTGRTGAIAVPQRLRRQAPGGGMQALIGQWSRPAGWDLDDPSHTYIETCDNGWAWSIPLSATTRHVGAMIHGATSRVDRGADFEATYRAQLARTPRLRAQAEQAHLEHAFACDASVYDASAYGGARFLLAGDAGSTLNPLSSFGVKKALASAWLTAIVAHTCMRHRDRAEAAMRFHDDWEAQVWQINLRNSRDFAREAFARHQTPFWQAQTEAPVDEARIPLEDTERLVQPAVRAALDRLKASDVLSFTCAPGCFETAPLVRGREIALEDAVRLGDRQADLVRYVRGIDVVSLARLAPESTSVAALFERYVARHGHTSAPDLVGALALLVAARVVVPAAR
jgi:flavin-dependent dehydrogenase